MDIGWGGAVQPKNDWAARDLKEGWISRLPFLIFSFLLFLAQQYWRVLIAPTCPTFVEIRGPAVEVALDIHCPTLPIKVQPSTLDELRETELKQLRSTQKNEVQAPAPAVVDWDLLL